ncbi:MAG TPA: DegT/DnrJ/EryC1/StrS family aminotransferase, partial [Candidatus Binatia bacterium]|nr:DegT/DnrJ/EryC1/StrS family aminotransferase [Candidatus Binatia bacterium]
SEFIPFHKPAIGEEEIRSVVETLRSGWLTTGPKVKLFEAEFATYTGSSHAVAVNSATAALHLALEAVGIKSGDEVIVPTMTFTATAEVVLYLGARPVLVDCRTDDLNIDVDRIEAAITKNTKAIVPVHIAGRPCAMDQILAIAQRHGLRVIEDAAHALPASHCGRKVGAIGDITCFSFYATKTITTGEGGMATTNNPEWASRMRMMSLHGISHDAWDRYTEQGSWYYEVLRPGYKYNMTDIAAALGIEQLKKCDAFYQARLRIAESYGQAFADLPEIETPGDSSGLQHAWHLYIIQLNPDRLRIDRRDFIKALNSRKIGTSVHFIPLHLHPFYKQTYGYQASDFPQASTAFDRIVSLPIYPMMTERDVSCVIGAVRDLVQEYRR